MNKQSFKIILLISVILILLIVGVAYWYFFFNGAGSKVTPNVMGGRISNGFTPFGRTGTTNVGSSTASGNNQNTVIVTPPIQVKIASLRNLSNTPIGGYAASTSANTTIVRWIDRGKGNVYELAEDSTNVVTLSNTLLPRMYESVWNKNLTAFIGSILSDNASAPTTVYAQLVGQAIVTKSASNNASTTTASTTASKVIVPTATTLTPYELKGKNLPDGIIAYAASPKRDKIFLLIDENGSGIGYTATFDGKSMTKIFDMPLTKLNVDWPEENTIAITTKGAASLDGFLYFVNPKTGIWKKVAGPLPGLSAKVSHDAKYAIISSTGGNQNIMTNILDVSKNISADAVIRTLADKCVWGNFYKNIVYCGVPSQAVAGTYPDDWYKGMVSLIDKIWQVNAGTGEVHLVSSIVDQSDRVIDAYNLGLDAKDNYLFFMNKNDLSFWSLDLVSAH